MSDVIKPEVIPASTGSFALTVAEAVDCEVNEQMVTQAVEEICEAASVISLQDDGIGAVEENRKRLKKLRSAIDKHRKSLGADLRERLNEINAAGNFLISKIEPAEQRLIQLSGEYKAEQERMAREREEAERKRLNDLNADRLKCLGDVETALTEGRWFADLSAEEWESEKSRILKKDAEMKEQQRIAAEKEAAAQAEIERLKAENARREELERQAEEHKKAMREECSRQRWACIHDHGVGNEWVGDPADFTEQSFNQIMDRLIDEKRQRKEREDALNEQISLAASLVDDAANAQPEVDQDSFAPFLHAVKTGAFKDCEEVSNAFDVRLREVQRMIEAKKAADEARERAERELHEKKVAEEKAIADLRSRLTSVAESAKRRIEFDSLPACAIESYDDGERLFSEQKYAEFRSKSAALLKMRAERFLAATTEWIGTCDCSRQFEELQAIIIEAANQCMEEHTEGTAVRYQQMKDAEASRLDRHKIHQVISPAIDSIENMEDLHPSINVAEIAGSLRAILMAYNLA